MKIFLVILAFLFPAFVLNVEATQVTDTSETLHYFMAMPRLWETVDRVYEFPGMDEVLAGIDSLSYSFKDKRNIFVVGDEVFGNGDCGLEIFQYKDGTTKNLYNYTNRGYTCTTYIFRRDKLFYMLGGYGYWVFHSDLMVFDPMQGAWELIITENQPLDYYSRIRYNTPGGILVLLGGYSNSRYKKMQKEKNGYLLDWETKSWKKVTIDFIGDYGRILKEKFVGESSWDLENYGIVFTAGEPEENGVFIIDKKTFEVYFYDLGVRDLMLSEFVEIEGDLITYLHYGEEYRRLPIDEIVADAKLIGSIRLEAKDEEEGKNLAYPLVGLAFMGLVLIGTLSFLRKRKVEAEEEEVEKIEPMDGGLDTFDAIIAELTIHSGKMLNGDEVNEILKLDSDKSMESSRVERSRMIKKVNSIYKERFGRELIARTRSIEDKRIILYQINP